jgi:antitoxin component of RelBE/YafQ-DinJ toxin-antitoxin module
MKPLQISPETAQKLAEQLKIPIEHLLHMPQHILLQKLAELAKDQTEASSNTDHKDSNSF